VGNVDKVEILIKAGKGGDGAISFRHEKYVPLGGPDGGDGGDGGSVYLAADRNVNNLSTFRHKKVFKAFHGTNGSKQKKYGKKGDDLEIKVPVGTEVYKIEGTESLFTVDLREDGQRALIAQGGKGGMGNSHFATPTNQAPQKATLGKVGDEIKIMLDQKIIADVGIIGYPNVGKSTLLAAVSAAKPKIADYPFTTLEPILGEVRLGKTVFTLAEIPGLIEGAHLGKGLGHTFLRHVERTKVLLHIIDGSSNNISEDFDQVNKELELYKKELAQKPQIVAVNKEDLPEVKAGIPGIERFFKSRNREVYFISGATGYGVSDLMARIAALLKNIAENEIEPQKPLMVFRPKPVDRQR
jgi:GTPase